MTLEPLCFTTGRNRGGGKQAITAPTDIENVWSLLSQPGQYYQNVSVSQSGETTYTFYYVPRPGDDMATAQMVVPTAETLIEVWGDDYSVPGTVTPVANLAFVGLQFSYTTWLQPTTSGFIDNQAMWLYYGQVPGVVWLHSAVNVSIVNCSFTHVGGHGVAVDHSSQGVTIADSDFTDISAGAMYLGNTNDSHVTAADLQTAGLLITNNIVVGVPMEYRGAAGVWSGYVRDSMYTYNTIDTCPNGCFELGWGWGSNISYAGNNSIVANHVVRSNQLMVDCGSLYVNGMQARPSLMAENYCEDQALKYGTLYPDEGSSHWLITRNVVHNVPEWLGIWTTSIHDITVVDNWSDQTYQVVNVSAALPWHPRTLSLPLTHYGARAATSQGVNITLANNTFVTPGSPFPPEAQAIMAAAGAQR